MSFEEIVGLIPEILSETVYPLLKATYDAVCDVVDSINDYIEENFQDVFVFFCLAIESNTTYSSKKSYNKSKQLRKSKKSK